MEISPTANPPVCRIMNFGKFRYEESRKEKMARKHQSSAIVKEVKFHANVEDHDYVTKLRHVTDFLDKGHRVKTSLMFRGRENEHRELGYNLMSRMIKDCESLGAPESPPKMFGNNLVVMMRPMKGVAAAKAEGAKSHNPAPPSRPPASPIPVPPPSVP